MVALVYLETIFQYPLIGLHVSLGFEVEWSVRRRILKPWIFYSRQKTNAGNHRDKISNFKINK